MKARSKFLVGSGIIVVTLVSLAYVGFTQSKTYYHTISELGTLQNSALHQRMRVSGKPVVVSALLIIGIVNLSAVAAIWNTYYSSTPRNLAGGGQRPERPIFGNVDAPKEGSVVTQTCTVRGWAVASGSSVTKVGIYIDGRFEQQAAIGSARPDVQGVFPDEPGAPTSGFAAELNVAHLPSGDHILTVHAETAGGDVANVGTVRIRVAK